MASVDEFLSHLVHPHHDAVEALRATLLEGVPELAEHVKWNAPSFTVAGVDRVTFRLQPHDRVQLVLHRGAKVLPPVAFELVDPEGLVTWVAPDRGVIDVIDAADAKAKAARICALVRQWIRV